MAVTGPFVVSILEVQRSLGAQRAAELTGTLPGVEVTDAHVDANVPVTASITVESTASTEITVTGRVEAPFVAVCRRCLGPVQGQLVADIREVYEPRPVEGETYPLTRDWIDLAPMLHDAIMLALPVAPLCRPDCPGPEPDVFPVAIGAPAADEEPGRPTGDPRWAALDALRLSDHPDRVPHEPDGLPN